jgi:tetratricopeptide (TPR) repeat protein
MGGRGGRSRRFVLAAVIGAGLGSGGCGGTGVVFGSGVPVPIPGEKVFIVTSDPPGATVLVNGKEAGETPANVRWLPLFTTEQRARLEFRKADYGAALISLDFARAEAVVEATAGVNVSRESGQVRETFTVHVSMRLVDLKAYDRARVEDSVAAYELFLSRYPSSVLGAEARQRIAELLFRGAVSQNTREAYRAFLADLRSQASPMAQEGAGRRLAQLSFEEARRRNTPMAYQQFLEEFGERSEYGSLASERIRDIRTEIERRLATAARLSLQGAVNEAAREYEQAINLSPEHAEPYYQLAVLYEQEGRLDLAQRYITEAIRRAPGHAGYLEVAARLRGGSGSK